MNRFPSFFKYLLKAYCVPDTMALCFKEFWSETITTVVKIKVIRLFVVIKLSLHIKYYLCYFLIYFPNNFKLFFCFVLQGAFSGWKVILHVDQSREAGFKRLLQSGGAKVCIKSTYWIFYVNYFLTKVAVFSTWFPLLLRL